MRFLLDVISPPFFRSTGRRLFQSNAFRKVICHVYFDKPSPVRGR